jgi:hypothetical protein
MSYWFPMQLRLLALPAAAALLLSLPVATSAAGGGASFVNFEVSGTPPHSTGTSCPQQANSPDCTNAAAEPQIRAARDGAFYATSENGLGGGTLAWKSTDHGLHYATLDSPDIAASSPATGSLSPAGGDTDLATAPNANPSGHYNVYVASLELASVMVSTSADGGKTWTKNPTGATIPGDDREWVAADGASKVCISYHDVATFNIDVDCSADAGATFTQLGGAIDPAHAYAIDNNEIGNLAVDPASHYVYQTFSAIATASEAVCSTAGTCGYHAVYVGVSTDGGQTFTDHAVYVNPDSKVSYGHQFVNLSVDRAGNLYSVFSDNHNTWIAYSRDHGTTWSKPLQVNSGAAKTAIMPWSAAGDPGRVDVVYYGADYYGSEQPDSYPASTQWHVFFAQSLNLFDGGGFTQVAASPVNHTGAVCEGGISCTGNRDLYDDFGIAVDPATGLASIVYSDDQWSQNTSGCAQSSNGTPGCDHTAFATQTGGPGVYSTTAVAGRKKGVDG